VCAPGTAAESDICGVKEVDAKEAPEAIAFIFMIMLVLIQPYASKASYSFFGNTEAKAEVSLANDAQAVVTNGGRVRASITCLW